MGGFVNFNFIWIRFCILRFIILFISSICTWRGEMVFIMVMVADAGELVLITTVWRDINKSKAMESGGSSVIDDVRAAENHTSIIGRVIA